MAFQYVRADQASEYNGDVILTNTNRVGAGTTAPTAKTEIDGGAAVSGTKNLSTSGSSTAVTTTSNAFASVQIGAALTANSVTRYVVAKTDSNNLTVDFAVNWSAGYSFTYKNPILKLSDNGTNRLMVRADGASFFSGDIIATGPWFDVRAYGATPLQLQNFGRGSGTINSSNNQISDTGLTGGFANSQVGDSLWILVGANFGRYTITAKNGNVVTVGAGIFTQNQSNVDWNVTAGVVDSSQAFQNALNAAAAQVNMMLSNGGVVYVPKGTFRIASKLSIPLGVSLVGAGREGTILLADFAEKTGGANFSNGSNSVSNITGSLAVGDYAKVATHDFTALARIQTLGSGTATLHVNYYGVNGSGYQTVTPVIEINSTSYSSVKELTINTAQFQQHIGINVFHAGVQTLENVEIKNMYVGVFVSNSYTDGRNVSVHYCKTGIHFGNPGQDPSNPNNHPDFSTCNYFYGGAAGNCTQYGVRFVEAWGNLIYGMDIGYNIGARHGCTGELGRRE